MSLLIKGGTVVSPWGRKEMDVLVEGEKIAALGKFEDINVDRIIDAKGKMVIPGGIDCHSHLETPFQGAKGGDDFYTGTVAAAIGGTTSIIDFSITPKGVSPMEFLKKRINDAKERGAVIDFSFHACLTEAPKEVIDEIGDLVEYGAASFKVFMIYRKEGFMMDDGSLMAVMEEAKKYNGLIGVHAENAAIAEYRAEKLLKEGKKGWFNHTIFKPNFVEAEAISRVAFLAKELNTGMFIFHMSTKEGAAICKEAHEKGIPLYSETCSHYLTFNEDVLKNEETGHRFLLSPPLRKDIDIDALWNGLSNKAISVTSSDHAPFTTEEKEMFLDRDSNGDIIKDFTKVPNGVPGNELVVPTLINGVSEGKLTWEQLVYVNSYGASKIFGLSPNKGLIEVGADADIVIVDPDKEVEVTNSMLHMKVDYTIYEGCKYKGWPVMTIARGEILAENGEFVGTKGHGKYVKRKISPEILKCSDWQ